jgi:hypothetical protein
MRAGRLESGAADQGHPGGVMVVPAAPPPRRPAAPLTCQRCGFPVSGRPQGCKNPCRNCGTVYPLGDCSD